MLAQSERIKACVRAEDLAKFILVEVKDEDNLERLAHQLAAPILDCEPHGMDLVLDARDRIAYELKHR